MPYPKITTDWICVSTAGQAVDGRTIEPQWLRDAAATYSRNTYTAMIWPHHPQYDLSERQFTCNLGEVDALKVEEFEGVVKLYAKLIPNQFLIDANRMGQKLFTSAEFWPDFGGTGQEYLFGLAVTDIPASMGTEKITFVYDGEELNGSRGNIEVFSLGEIKKPSLWSRLFTAKKGKEFTPDTDTETNQPDTGEDETKMEELRALLEALTTRIDAIEAKATGDADTPEAAAVDIGALAEEIAAVADEVVQIADEVAANPEDQVVTEEFTVITTKLAALLKGYSAKAPATAKAPGRSARQSRRQAKELSVKPADKSEDLTAIRAELALVMQKFTAMEGTATKLPSSTPAPGKQPFEFT
ncbi:GPO family capsid scaffolding protein [Edaphovirga cremea]|uniref:GPO family capsid scaffolding protein n=1 Tax=Edaphovirga cremea TaxID=2267246 RepID=UPI003989EA96